MFFFFKIPRPLRSTLFPYTTLFRSTSMPKNGRVSRRIPARVTSLSPPSITKALRCLHPRCHRSTLSMPRSEEHTSELQSRQYLVCRLLLEKKKQSNKTDQYQRSRPQ